MIPSALKCAERRNYCEHSEVGRWRWQIDFHVGLFHTWLFVLCVLTLCIWTVNKAVGFSTVLQVVYVFRVWLNSYFLSCQLKELPLALHTNQPKLRHSPTLRSRESVVHCFTGREQQVVGVYSVFVWRQPVISLARAWCGFNYDYFVTPVTETNASVSKP